MKFKGMPQFRFNIAQKLIPVPPEFRQTPGGLYVAYDPTLQTMGGVTIESLIDARLEPSPAPPPEPPYEVNMMEALVGWKTWNLVNTSNGDFLETRASFWMPDGPLEAVCLPPRGPCYEIPNEQCTCGIYAADSKNEAMAHNDIVGLVYGWGRYVRGTDGWRAQYAYPKCFWLTEYQAGRYIDALKKYHVPIYVSQPTLIYNPEEDGYEHRGEEENWNIRAIEESATAEEDDADY
jgi:hypothetical protein